jgi:DNA-binding MarR family transcriptional regulator
VAARLQKSGLRQREVLERRALFAARALVDRMRTLYRELERLTGAPIAVHRALTCIEAEPGIVASRLALALGMQRPALSHVLRGLAERGWVERVRSDADQRSVRVYLTPAGRQLLGATAGRAVGALQRAVRQLSNTSLDGLAAGLEQMLSHLPPAANDAGARPRASSTQRGARTTTAGAPATGTERNAVRPARTRSSARVMR